MQIYFIISSNFLCGFFIINALWIPPLSIPTLSRIFVWFLLSNLVFKEGYNLLESRDDPDRRKMKFDPSFRWVTFGIIAMEIAISVKFSENTGNLTNETMSPVVFYGWLIAFALIGYYYIHLRWIRNTDKEFELKHQNSSPMKATPRRGTRRSSSKKNK